MKKILRKDIHLLSQHSNISENGIETALKENVYNNKEQWQKFLKILFISLGIGFSVLGVIFFFAYNWADIHKFIKIGLIECSIVLAAIFLYLPKINSNLKNIILTCLSILVGVLFAVFGQIYQTGANSFDFFLGWTVFVTLWVVFSNFPPLWLIYITLINTTIVFYFIQVALDWTEEGLLNLLFFINSIFLLSFILLSKKYMEVKIPSWFIKLVALSVITYSTLGISVGFFENNYSLLLLFFITAIPMYALGIWYGLKIKKGFYLAIIAFSIIIIFSVFVIKLADGHVQIMLLLVGLFIIGSVTSVIKKLISLQETWRNEE